MVAGIGEVLWDINGEEKNFGGAPANFACHCNDLGAETYLFSSVGDDDLGLSIVDFLKDKKINISTLDISNKKSTGSARVKLNDLGNPQYEIKENVAYDYIKCDQNKLKISAKLDAICFGTISQRNKVSRSSIVKILKSTNSQCLVLFDMNLRQSYYDDDIIISSLKLSNAIKINSEELVILSKILKIQGSEKELMIIIQDIFDLNLVILTCGKEGSFILKNKEFNYRKASKINNIVSTVGAGDCFTAAVVMGYLNNNTLDEINKKANLLASYVCTQNGAVPRIPKELTIK